MLKPKKKEITTQIKLARIAFVFIFFLLVSVLWFAFNAVSVRFSARPDNANIEFLSSYVIPLNDRFLLLPGLYEVTARAQGYYNLIQQVEVGDESNQEQSLVLEAMPGIITVAIEPEINAEVYLDGIFINETPVETNLSAGSYLLEIKKLGYLDLIDELDIEGAGNEQNFYYELILDQSEVRITSNPVGAEVYIDNDFFGVTPITAVTNSGSHVIQYNKMGYESQTVSIYLEPEEIVELAVVNLDQQQISLNITSNPDAASILVNGSFIGVTPYIYEYPEGQEIELIISKLGYEQQQFIPNKMDSLSESLSVNLVPELAQVEVTGGPSGAEISIDGQVIGIAPLVFDVLALPHMLGISLDGYIEQEYQFSAQKDERYVWQYDLDLKNPLTGDGYRLFYETSLSQQMRLVLPASFEMGSSRREQGRRSNEVIRNVIISQPYYLGIKEVTNAEYRTFNPNYSSGSFAGISLNEDNQPVVGLEWNEVAEYLNWLSIMDELQPVYEFIAGVYRPILPLRNGYRLPTEAEWDRASRLDAEDQVNTFGWGNSYPPDDRQANIADISSGNIFNVIVNNYSDGYVVTSEVGKFAPNSWGLFDLDGNVSEWVQDFYEVPVVTETEVIDPMGPLDGRFHVYRGPNWRSGGISEIRLSYRGFSDQSHDYIGFRIAKNGQ